MQDNTNNSNEWNLETAEGNPLAPVNEMTPEDIYNASMANEARFVGSYVTSMRNFAHREHDRDVRTGTKAIQNYTKRLEDFQTAYENGSFDEKEMFDLVRKDAKAHATGDRFFYETYHEGAWEQARSMTSDEHTMLLGTDMRARNQYLHDSSEASELAGMLGLGNTDYFRNMMKERGIDTSQEGNWTDTFTSLFSLKDNALFNYENLIDEIGQRKDPEWNSDARDNAWSRMNATETAKDIVRATGITREALDRLPNQDSLIYIMNRKWKEAKFAQHASQDAYGGMIESFGQMLPSIASDPDTIGELSIAALLALPSAGTSLGAYAAAKIGSTGLAKGALTLHRVAKAGSKASKLLPSRVLGDFIVPGVRASKAGNKAGITGWDNMRFAWNQMDEYENWPTFLAGASVNGFVGGAGAFAYNASRVDALNDQVYGKGAMPSVMTLENLTFRGMMGVGGAIMVGSGIRTTMQAAGAGIAKQLANPKFRDILGLDKNKVARLYEGGLIERAIEKGGGEATPGTVEVVAASIERQADVVGADKRDVTLSVAEKLGRVEEDITDADISIAVREAVAEQAQTPRAREARAVREERLARYQKSAELESTRVESEHAAELNRLQSSAIVRAGRVEMNEAEIEAKVNDGVDARADDADLDAVLEAREAADKLNIDNAIKSTEARRTKTESKKSDEQRKAELARKQEAADKAAAKRQARIDEANRAAQEATETQSQREAEVKQIEATEEKVGLAEAIRLAEQAKQKASEAIESAESASKAPEVDRPTEISDVSKKDVKAARKASAEASREALSAKQAADELTQKLAKKWGVDADEIESVIAEAVSWRRTRAARQHLVNMLEAMEAEGLDGVPEAVFRHMVKGLNPKWADSWDGNDGDLIDFETAKGLANEAARKQQAQNFTDLLDSQDALAISNALTRGSYGELKEMLDKLAEEGPGQAVNAAAKLKLLTGGGNLRDLDFKGDGIYLKDQAYMDAAIKNVKDIEDSLAALEVKVDGSPRDYIDRIPEMNTKEMVYELVNTHGFADTQEFNNVQNHQVKELLGYMRWLSDVQKKVDSGEIDGDVLIGLGLDNGAQAIYLTRTLAMVEGEILRLKQNGQMPHMSEVEMYRLIPAYYTGAAGRSGLGTNLRDGMLHKARVTGGGDQYDLIQVRNILSERLASVDADYNRARTAAAQAELKKLEEAVESDGADLDSRIRLNVYRNRNKVVNEIDFLEKEILTTYREIAMEKARARRDEMGNEAYRQYLDEETLNIQQGLIDAIARNPMSAERRTDFMNKYGISSSGRKPAQMSDKDWTNFLADKLQEVAERELGFPLRDLINGKQAAVSGHHAGRAAYAALAWQRTITGDAANPASTAGARAKGADVYHHVNFGADRQANDMGNLSVRKQVDFINKHLLNETERQILFDAEGNPRVFDEAESMAIIDYYLKLKEMSAEEMAEVTPRLPFEQRYRQKTLTGRDTRVDEPLRGWTTIQQRVDRQLDKILRTPPVLIQGIHDDLTFAISMGPDGNTGLTSRAGFLNDTNEGAQGAGRAYGLGAGWQTVFAVPGSVADFLNTRSAMVFKQLEGMDEFARALGMKSLMEIREEYAARLMEGGQAESGTAKNYDRGFDNPNRSPEVKDIQDDIASVSGYARFDENTWEVVRRSSARIAKEVKRASEAGDKDTVAELFWLMDAVLRLGDRDRRNLADWKGSKNAKASTATKRQKKELALLEKDAAVVREAVEQLGGKAKFFQARTPGTGMYTVKITNPDGSVRIKEVEGVARGQIESDIDSWKELDMEDGVKRTYELDEEVKNETEAIEPEAPFAPETRSEGGGLTEAESRKAAEVATLIDLDKAVRIVKNNMRTEEELLAFEAKDAENLQNAWDASSQAVSLAKGLFGAIRSQAGEEGFLPGDVLRDALSALGWSERDGLLNEDIRMFILSREGTTAEMGKALAEADLAENAADFYSKVWDFMYDLPSGNPRDGERGRMSGMYPNGTGIASHVAIEHGVSAEALRAGANLWDSVFEGIGKWGGKTEIKAEAKGVDPAEYLPYQNAMMKGWMRDKLMKRPVMTRAYGAGGQAMREAVKDFLMEALTADTAEAAIFRNMLMEQDPASAKVLIEEAQAGRRDSATLVHAMGANLGWAFADSPPGSAPKGQGLRMGEALQMPTAPEFRDLMRGLASVHEDMFDPAKTDLIIPGYENEPGKMGIGDAYFSPARAITWDDVYSYRSVDETASGDESVKEAEANEALSRQALNQQARAVAVRRGWDKDAPEELLEVLGMWHIRNLLQVQAGNSTAKQMMKLEAAVFGDMQAIIDKGGPTMYRDLESFLQNWLVKPDTQILRGMNSVGLHPVKARYEQGLSNAGLTVDDVDPRARYAMETGTALHTQVASSAGRQFNNAQGSKGYVDEETGMYIYHTNRGNSDEVQGAANDFGHGIMRGWDEMSPEERQRAALQMVAQDLMLDFAGVVNPPVKDFVEPTPQGWLRAVAENEGNAARVLEDRARAREAWKANTEAKEGLGIDERADILQDDIRVEVGSHHGLTMTEEVTPGDSSVDVGIPQLQLYKLQTTSDAVAKRQLEAAAKGRVATSGIRLGELAVPATLKIAPEIAAVASVEGHHSPDMSMMDGFRMEQDPEWVFNFTAREVYEYALGAGITIKTPADLRRVWGEMQIERGLDEAFDDAARWADKAKNENDEFTLDTLAGKTQLGDAMWLAYNRYTESAFGQPLIPASKEHGHRSVQRLEDKGTAYPSENLVDGLAQTFLQGGNRENADAVFGPAHRAGLVLRGDHRVSPALMTGLMAKSVFHQDFAIGMGAAVEHYRFGMWFLKQKHPDMSTEDLALNFERLFAKRLEDKDEYNKLFQQWRDGDLDLGDGDVDSLPNSLSTFATLGAVRERLAEDPAAMELANKVFGIERPEDLTDDVLRDTLKVMQFGDDSRTPDALLDSIGRSLTNDKVPTGTVLWRTMEQFRAAGVDPGSQPLVRRLWLAAMLEREVDKLNLRDGMGAVQQRPLGYTLFGPKDQKVSSERLDAARSTTAEVLGMKDGMDWDPSARPDGMNQSNALANVVKRRMNRTLQAAEDNGIVKKGTLKEILSIEKEMAELEAKMATNGFGTDAAKAEAKARLAELKEKFVPLEAARVVNFQYVKFGGNKKAAEAMFLSNDRAFRQNFGMKADKEAWNNAWTVIDKRYAEINEEVKESLTQDLAGALGKPDQANERAFSSETANNIINASETARVVSPEAREAAKVQAEAIHDGTLLSKGDPDAADSDPIFGEGRTLFNDFDDVVRAKRYPALDKLVNTLVDNGVMDKAEARKLAAMLAMNGDVVGNLIEGIEFTYTGEKGSSSAVSVVNSAAELESRIKLTSELNGMDAMGAFDIIAHEIGHVILHRAQAERTGKGGAHRSQSDRHIKTMLNDFRNRALKSSEFRQEIVDTFVSMHGEDRGNQMASNFLKSIMHEMKENSPGRSDYTIAFNEFFAQMMSWHLLSRVDTLQIVTPFMRELGVLYRSGWGENIRRATKLTDPDPKILDPKGTARRSLERLAQIANHAAPAVWATGRAAKFSGVEMFAPTRRSEADLRAKKDELVARLEADSKDMVAEVELRTVINQMRELQRGVFDETSFRDLILRQTESSEDRFFYDAGFETDKPGEPGGIEKLGEELKKTGRVPDQAEIGVVNPRNLIQQDRQLLEDAMLESLMSGRHDTWGDSKIRKMISTFGEGMALQDHSSAWNSMSVEVQLLGNLLNPGLSFQQMRNGTRIKPVSLQQLDLYIASRMDPAMEMAVELAKVVAKRAKKDPTFGSLVNRAFEEAFKNAGKGGSPETPNLDELQAKDPNSANLAEQAGERFAKVYDDAYKSANRAGQIDDWVLKSLLADRQLPLHLSEAFKNGNTMPTVAGDIARGISDNLLQRLRGTSGDGREYYLSAEVMREFGILAPDHVRGGASVRGRAGHVSALDEAEATKGVVDGVIEYAKLNGDEAVKKMVGDANRVDAYFYAADFMNTAIRHGKLNATGLPPAVYKAYAAALTDPQSFPRDVYTDVNNREYFQEKIDQDFPDPDDRRQMKSVMFNGPRRVDYLTYTAMKMLHKARHGGYSFADSQFISGDQFRTLIGSAATRNDKGEILYDGDQLHDVGLNMSPISIMGTFKPQFFSWTDKAVNQNLTGIQGYGVADIFQIVRRRVVNGTIRTKDGGEHRLSPKEQDTLLAAIESVETQARLAMGRRPKVDQDGAAIAVDAVSPLMASAMNLMTVPNWTPASLITEGTAGIARRVTDWVKGKTNFGSFSYFKDKSQMRDELHALGLALPYQMASIGFSHMLHYGLDEAAAMDLDPSVRKTGVDKFNEVTRTLGNFGFERVSLAQRHQMLAPSYEMFRRVSIADETGKSKLHKLSDEIDSWYDSAGEGAELTMKDLKKLAKKTGVDQRIAWQLWQMDVFSDKYVLNRVSDFTQKYLAKNSPLNVEEMMDEVQATDMILDVSPEEARARMSNRAREVAGARDMAAATAIQKTIHYLVTRTNLEPEAGTRVTAKNPLIRMWSQLTSFALAFMRNTLAATAGGGVGVTASLIIPMFMGETIWYTINRMKNGEDLKKISAEAASDPTGFLMKAFLRMPILGAGSVITEPVISAALGMVNKSGLTGDQLSTFAQERTFGMSNPGMPGVSMFLQALGNISDSVRNVAGAKDLETATAEAKEIMYKMAPVDFRPLWVAAIRQATGDFKEQESRHSSERPRSMRPASAAGIMREAPVSRNIPRYEQIAEDYATKMAESVIRSSAPPKDRNSSGGMETPPAANNAAGMAQTQSSGLSGPKRPTTGGDFGPGSASGALADRK